MHWWDLSIKTGLQEIGDWGYLGITKVQVFGQPQDGYGPYHSQLLKRLNGKPALNADNYAWFAIEAYFAATCQHAFVDATSNGPEDPDQVPQPDFVADPVQGVGPAPAPAPQPSASA